MITKKINLPIDSPTLQGLNCGDIILLSGTVFTARDAAHRLICDALDSNLPPPFELKNATIYYCGPSQAKPNETIGSCGPTSSTRMDAFAPKLLDYGVKIMIGKGLRSDQVIQSMIKNQAVYLAAVGGAAALVKQHITECETIAYEFLGCEAIHRLQISNLPLIVAIDSRGNSAFSV